MNDENIKMPIIIDSGSYMVKAGFAGDPAPYFTFRSAISYPRFTTTTPIVEDDYRRDIGIGNDAWLAHDENGFFKVEFPIEFGKCFDFNGLERLWHHLFHERMHVDPSQHPVLLLTSPMTPSNHLGKAMGILFETFNVPALGFLGSAVSALNGVGFETTGVVVELGYQASYITPIYQTFPLSHAMKKTMLGTVHVDKILIQALKAAGFPYQERHHWKLIDIIKKHDCIVSPRADGTIPQGSQVLHPCIKYIPRFNTGVSNEAVDIGNALVLAPEIYFQPSIMNTVQSLSLYVVDSITECDPEIQEDLWKNLVVCGGAAGFSGMKARLEREINALDEGGPGTRSVHVPVKPEYLAWKGASRLLERYGDDVKWITKQEFEKEGPGISWSSFLPDYLWENDP